MKDEKAGKAAGVSASRSNSYLVRVWTEFGDEPKVRFYLRDLKSGVERYLTEPGRVADSLTMGLAAEEEKEERRRELG